MTLSRFVAIFLLLAISGFAAATPPVPGFPIGRCVRVVGVTAPEDAKAVGFEYLELALQDLLPIADQEFERIVTRLAEGLELVRAVNHPNFQMLVDYSFMAQGKEDLAILHKAAPHIRQVEISNPNGRVYPRVAEEADYASFFRALQQGGYKGGFSIHGQPQDFFVDAPRAIALLRTLITHAGFVKGESER